MSLRHVCASRLLSRVPPRQNFDLAEVSGALTEFTHESFTTGRIVLLALSPLVDPVLMATMAQVPLLVREPEDFNRSGMEICSLKHRSRKMTRIFPCKEYLGLCLSQGTPKTQKDSLIHPGSVKQCSGSQPSVYELMHDLHASDSCGVSPLAISAAQVSPSGY